jgi:hypothetical protein
MTRHSRSRYQVRNGFLSAPSYGPTLDSFRTRARDQEPQDPQDPEEELLEVHNHIDMSPGEEEQVISRYNPSEFRDDPPEEVGDEAQGEGEEVARYPASGYTVHTEGDQLVIYRTGSGSDSPAHKSDRHDMTGLTRDNHRSGPPRTLAQLNAFHQAHYRSKGGRR